jgi:hypothetical protein
MNKQDLLNSLKTLIKEQSENHPIPDRESLSAEEEWHCQIIGGDFIAWTQKHLPKILNERMVLKAMNFDQEPLIVFTTSMPGLVALKEIMPKPPEEMIFLLHSEFEKWNQQHSSDKYSSYIHHWSYFQDIKKEQLTLAKKLYSSVPENELRIHNRGDLWGENCGTFGEHLWQWNGDKMVLLLEEISHGVY